MNTPTPTTMPENTALVPIRWIGDAQRGHLRLLDQTRLPGEEAYLDCHDVESVWQAIKRLSVRGAPAIGIAAAYACVLAVQERNRRQDGRTLAPQQALEQAAEYLATSRPTAVNLFWALKRMSKARPIEPSTLLEHAAAIHDEDTRMCSLIGEHGYQIFQELAAGGARLSGRAADAPATFGSPGILTHCNAGALATGGMGTATAPMYVAHERGMPFRVFADETRQLLQGSRLTAFELGKAGIDVTLICDDMAAHVMREGKVDLVITGADRIAANGDAANKIGTYNLAVLAKYHGIPFYVAAPSSTFDLSLPDGGRIPIEERAAEEITEGFGKRTAPEGVKTYSPAFDVTPHELITGIITERGIIRPVNAETVREVVGEG